MNTWHVYAGIRDGEYQDFGHPQFVHAYGHKIAVLVTLTEDPEGEYWGWLGKDDDHPVMVYRREAEFRICFPYRPEEYAAQGQGRIVRLSVCETTSASLVKEVLGKCTSTAPAPWL